MSEKANGAGAANALALMKRDTVDLVAHKIHEFMEHGDLHLPAHYSAPNALKSAWLIIQQTVDRDKKPALSVCTRESVANALLDMVVQGLDPGKKQCYFIVYGNKLLCQRSYFGTMAVTKRAADVADIYAEVVYKGDTFKFAIERGCKRVVEHVQTLESMAQGDIVAAYCVILFPDGREHTDIMTIQEIRQAWKQSRNNPEDARSPHQKFPAEMCKKTVVNRGCKKILNSSDDHSLLMRTIRRNEAALAQAEADVDFAAEANSEPLDVAFSSPEEPEPTRAPAAGDPALDDAPPADWVSSDDPDPIPAEPGF